MSSPVMKCTRILTVSLIVLASGIGVARAETTEGKFYRACYLEQSEGDWVAAARLYEEVVADSRAERELRSKAEMRLAACREELASTDFARLMPPDAWAYVELRRPGDQMASLLDKLGLLADGRLIPAGGERRVAISPALIKGLLGIRGAAVAITGFNVVEQVPFGVAVFNAGNLEVVRGLIETALPVGGQATELIEGYPTYQIEGKVFVTLTSRLVVVSCDRSQIKGVVNRLNGTDKRSLAGNPALAEVTKDGNDSLLLFFVNAKAMMPMLKGMMAMGAMASPEAAAAQAILDLDSLNSLTGRIGVSGDGLYLDLGLRLDEGHRNLAYNFFRSPAIDHETLKCVPEGAAAFVAGAFNEAGSRYSSTPPGGSGALPAVTALDFGREIFCNITSFVFFALPPDGSQAQGGPPMPDVAAAITVNDPAKSEALWGQMLGIASLANGARVIEGTPVQIEGMAVRSYSFPEGITIYFAIDGNDLLVASSKSAMGRTIRAKAQGESIFKDKAFAASLARITPDATKAVFVHGSRVAQVARQFMGPGEVAEMEPFVALLSDTVASFVVDYSSELFRISAMLTGIPDVGDLVAGMITEEMQKEEARGHLKQSMKEKKWDEASKVIETQLSEQPESLKLLKTKFEILATGKKDREAAMRCGEAILEKMRDDADALNSSAWNLLTEEKYGDGFSELALKASERSNELTNYDNWMYVDTLALAKFRTGDAEAAVKLEKKAIELCGDCWGLGDMKKALAKFAARSQSP